MQIRISVPRLKDRMAALVGWRMRFACLTLVVCAAVQVSWRSSRVPDEVARRWVTNPHVAALEGEIARPPDGSSESRRYRPPALFHGGTPDWVEALPTGTGHARARDIDQMIGEGRHEEALAQCREEVAHHPGDLELRFLLASLIENVAVDHGEVELDESLRHLDEIVGRVPGFEPAWRMRAVHLFCLDRSDEGMASIDKALAIRSTWEGHLERGIALCYQGRFDEAEWDLWRTVELAPRDGNAYYDLAWIYAQQGDAEKTVEMLRFTSRDATLFCERMSTLDLFLDRSFGSVRMDPVYIRYALRLPRLALAHEHRRWQSESPSS